MKTSSIKYLGNLRTEATHLRSGNKIITDAPVDNHGKGEAFSPTDLASTASKKNRSYRDRLIYAKKRIYNQTKNYS